MPRWILDWQDRSGDPARRALVSVDSVEEFRERVRKTLDGETCTPEEAEEFRGPDAVPAIEAFQQEVVDLMNDADILSTLWSGVTLECDNGFLHVVREK